MWNVFYLLSLFRAKVFKSADKLSEEIDHSVTGSNLENQNYRCEICKLEFQSKLELTGHRAGKHRSNKCLVCDQVFENNGKLGRHKIEIHGYTREQLGWNRGGWNKGKGVRIGKFNRVVTTHSNPEFLSKMNSQEYANLTPRRFHEAVVAMKEKELRAQGFRTFNTSNYTPHKRIPDIIAITPEGKILAVELETLRRYKSSVSSLGKKYTPLLMQNKFFDDVLVEGF